MSTLLKRILLLILHLAFAIPALATPLPNPDPALYGKDSGDLTFLHGATLLAVYGVNPMSAEFGFFYPGQPATHKIFDTSNGPLTTSVVDFSAGTVFDVTHSTLQALFPPSVGTIGFYFGFPNPPGGTQLPGLFTLDSLNPGATRMVGTFPVLGATGRYAIVGFMDVGNGLTPVASALVDGVIPVPEPMVYAQLILGLAVLGFFTRNRHRKMRAREQSLEAA